MTVRRTCRAVILAMLCAAVWMAAYGRPTFAEEPGPSAAPMPDYLDETADGAEEAAPPVEGYDSPWPDAIAPTSAFDPEMLSLLPVLRVGLVIDPARSGFSDVEPFRAFVERQLKVPVELVAFRTLRGLQGALIHGQVDYAPLSASAYADAYAQCGCVEPLAVPRAADGGTAWHAVLLVLSNSDYFGLADLEGARLAVSGPGSTAGRRVPFAAFRAEGFEPGTFFADRIEAAGPVEAAKAVLAGRAEAALGWSSLTGDPSQGYSRGTLKHLADLGIAAPERFRIVWTSSPVPHAPHVVRTAVPEPVRERLRALLLVLDRDDPGAYRSVAPDLPRGFEPVTSEDFAPLIAAAPQSGLKPLTPR